jgi:hypothetical protein
MRRTTVLVALLIATAAHATVDWSVPWRRVRFEATHGSTRIQIKGETLPDVSRISSLEIRVGRRRVSCDSRFYADVPYPHLQTLAMRFSGETDDVTGESVVALQFGEQPTDPETDRYSELRIAVENGRCVSREFAVPESGGGTRYQESLP